MSNLRVIAGLHLAGANEMAKEMLPYITSDEGRAIADYLTRPEESPTPSPETTEFAARILESVR